MPIQLIGRTIEGRAPGKRLLVTGGVHGDEFEPIAAVRKLESVVAPILQRGTVTLIPCVNEEAFLLGSRSASDGLDLARTCPGCSDGSITEQIAAGLSEVIRGADYYIDLHTGGAEYSIYPLAGYVLHANADILNAQRRMAQTFNLPVIWGTSPELEGRSLSVARDADVPAIYCEYGGSAVCSNDGVAAYVEGCLNVMAMLEMIDRPLPGSVVKHTVEDRRPSSGHLQVCHPSPVDGFFEPAVQLGETIDAGAPLGSIIETPCRHEGIVAKNRDSSTHCVRSEHHGIVIMLRTFPRILAGESVGVVLEIP